MNNQPQQRFCTNCGQPLAAGTAFCVVCGTPVGAPPPGVQQGYVPPAMSPMQSSGQAQDDLLMAGLAAGFAANQAGQNRQQGRRSRSRLSGCGCLLLMLVILAGPFIGFALTTGRLHTVFAYVAVGLVILFCLLILLAMLLTRSGREALAEGATEGCLDAILGGLFGSG